MLQTSLLATSTAAMRQAALNRLKAARKFLPLLRKPWTI